MSNFQDLRRTASMAWHDSDAHMRPHTVWLEGELWGVTRYYQVLELTAYRDQELTYERHLIILWEFDIRWRKLYSLTIDMLKPAVRKLDRTLLQLTFGFMIQHDPFLCIKYTIATRIHAPLWNEGEMKYAPPMESCDLFVLTALRSISSWGWVFRFDDDPEAPKHHVSALIVAIMKTNHKASFLRIACSAQFTASSVSFATCNVTFFCFLKLNALVSGSESRYVCAFVTILLSCRTISFC